MEDIVSDTTFGADFLKAIDRHIATNYRTMSCSNLAAVFWDTFEAMKEETGTSGGFPGLTEYLLFRFVYHSMGARFERELRTGATQGCLVFRDVAAPSMILSRCQRFKLPSGGATPDVTVSVNDKVVAAFEAKVYPTKGASGMKDEVEKLARLRRSRGAPDMRAMIVVFDSRETHPGVAALLDREARRRPWLASVWLRKDARPAYGVLAEAMLPSVLDRAP